MLILTEDLFRQPGVTMKSSFYLKLVSKAARVTRAERIQVFSINNLLVARRRIQCGYCPTLTQQQLTLPIYL